MIFGSRKTEMVSREDALPGRDHPVFSVPDTNEVLGTPLHGPWPEGSQVLYIAMGCFWGAERIMWRLPGVVSTAVGYMGGYTPNPTYEETCTARTGHTETVQVVYDPAAIDAEHILKAFWENHDSTTASRQGNDVGTQYRSAIFWTTPEQKAAAEATRDAFQQELDAHGFGRISTQIASADEVGPFWYAEGYHQQYLHKNPGGYCNHGPNGLTCPVGLLRQDQLPSQESVLPPS
ncbi:methionine sulfoxide reductase A [Nostocoides japonicum T1-X7]|uniref:Peptide methionine sulfoxide reductase MsrA n=1 Tax=Nostocoides japonicum T1-X7 TaxID=1194083 RepID=A0A077LVF2_9MICO|nr:peptide-methionine (S)-S-oxide reductase MsrA [Tetrasphaera japonica]CCH77913.1 methionine sulfoxide reductase A [Tetrasphaera japonica T1-X7]